jgi:hypothetical protein
VTETIDTDQDLRCIHMPYNGIDVCALGEEADTLVALGHHDPKQTLAALNVYAKSLGWSDLLDGDGTHDPDKWRQALDKLQPRWAVLVTECDDPGMHEDYMGTDGFCPRCREIAEATWWISYAAAESTPGAFPVMVWEA